jgi:hypothetical protein
MQLLYRSIFISTVFVFLSFSSAQAQTRAGGIIGMHFIKAASGSESLDYGEVAGVYVDHYLEQELYVFIAPIQLTKNDFDVIEVPVGFKYRFGEDEVAPYLAGGVAAAFILNPEYEKVVIKNGVTESASLRHRGVSLLPQLAIGMEIGYPGEAGFTVELRYSKGALSTSDNSAIEDVHTGNVMLTMTMLFL